MLSASLTLVGGRGMEEVEYWYNDNGYGGCKSALYRAIGQYARRHRYIYLGLTQQEPEARFRQHQRNWADGHKWDRMIVIYCARSFLRMQYVEDDLIRYAREKIDRAHYRCMMINSRKSQKPRRSETPNSYWVYILVQE